MCVGVVVEPCIREIEERIKEGVDQLPVRVVIAHMRQIFLHRYAAALDVVRQAVVGEKHIVHAHKVVRGDIAVGIDIIFVDIGSDVGSVGGYMLCAVYRKLITIYM